MRHFDDLSEYRHGLRIAPWATEVPRDNPLSDLYFWIWDDLPDEATFADTELNVGWIGVARGYSSGICPEEVVNFLRRACAHSKYHLSLEKYTSCDLCGEQLRDAEIRVQGRDCVFASPAGVLHYIERHHYLPPDSFQHAVLQTAARFPVSFRNRRRQVPKDLLTPTQPPPNLADVLIEIERNAPHVFANKLLSLSGCEDQQGWHLKFSLASNHSTITVQRDLDIPTRIILNSEQITFGLQTLMNSCFNEAIMRATSKHRA